MNKRAVAAVGAGVLALLGVGVLYMWAQGANERAFEGAKLVEVVRVTEVVPQGTKAEDLRGSTEQAKLPAEAVPEGAVTDLSQVAGLSTTAALQPGEILLSARMGSPGERGEGQTDVPKGMQELAIALDSQRTVASAVKPGDRVGVVVSYPRAGDDENLTKLVLENILVTRSTAALDVESGTGAMVTLALTGGDAAKLVNAMEFGKVWLTLQNSDTVKVGPDPIGAREVLR